ncbi:uncharacterized protein M421DRAFT_421180 [Didymella exigua CBS 183.55]|uniref:Uncharacterized protein n=1 Tax=Didymella exigua CBS 183.55 TaxID=1150837 RepID=A0A6A5RNR1_9PLEO|nr:uncharacterized protein M421DRAFT_421180 [Didymella exigua CBS 183.55]KAF1927976.1 hypothetical protein M421DRAFT_421180 [Didymella exigua CBS 183.55]
MGSLLSTSQPNLEWKSEAQFAMESSCFCVVCGSPFDLSGDIYNLDVEAARYKVNITHSRHQTVAYGAQWMRNHRLISSRHDIHHHNLAGLSEDDFHSACYNTSDSPDVFLSARSTWDDGSEHLFHIDGLYPDTNIPYIITFNAMQQAQDYDTVFPLHEDCLQISRRVIDHLQPVASDGQSRSSLSILNEILQSRFRQNAKRARSDSLIARNDLLDLCTATDMNGPRSVIGLSLLEWWEGLFDVSSHTPLLLQY